jgi:serine/threonine protein kinase
MLEAGDLIDDRYQLVEKLGEGGMGVVYRARHVKLGHEVALKALRDDALADDEFRARFLREAQIASRLTSPNVARVFDVGTLASGAPYIVMELLRGNDLDDELARRQALPISEAVDLVRQACEAMAEAHAAGVVHRDLKPANLFLTRQGSRTVVKVLDFGISRLDAPEEVRLTQTQAAFGTPLYMSPEAILSTKHADERADVWALGVILYELLAGRTPFVGDTATAIAVKVNVEEPPPLRSFRPDVPVELEAAILRALSKKLDRRWQTARALADALVPFGTEVAASSLPPTSGPSIVIEPARPVPPTVPGLASTEVGARTMPAVSRAVVEPTATHDVTPVPSTNPMRRGLVLALLVLGALGGAWLLRSKDAGPGAAPTTTSEPIANPGAAASTGAAPVGTSEAPRVEPGAPGASAASAPSPTSPAAAAPPASVRTALPPTAPTTLSGGAASGGPASTTNGPPAAVAPHPAAPPPRVAPLNPGGSPIGI